MRLDREKEKMKQEKERQQFPEQEKIRTFELEKLRMENDVLKSKCRSRIASDRDRKNSKLKHHMLWLRS